MLDVIKELIPLLDGAKDGVVWLVIAYFIVAIVKTAIWAGVIAFVAKATVEVVCRGKVSEVDVSMSKFSVGGRRYRLLCPTSEFQELLASIADKNGYIRSYGPPNPQANPKK